MASRTDPDKIRKARARIDRPGSDCKSPPGQVRPVVNPARCEGKADCVAVCPYDVFEIGRLSDDVYRAQPFFTRIKLTVHGRKTAHIPKADQCRACGLCVVACPERAISLIEFTG